MNSHLNWLYWLVHFINYYYWRTKTNSHFDTTFENTCGIFSISRVSMCMKQPQGLVGSWCTYQFGLVGPYPDPQLGYCHRSASFSWLSHSVWSGLGQHHVSRLEAQLPLVNTQFCGQCTSLAHQVLNQYQECCVWNCGHQDTCIID